MLDHPLQALPAEIQPGEVGVAPLQIDHHAQGLHIAFAGGCDNVLLTLFVDGKGTLDPAAGNHVVPRNTSVIVHATPAAGYVFANWTGDLAGTTANPANLEVNAAKTVGAVFAAAPQNIVTAAQLLLEGFTAADTDHSGGLSQAEAVAAVPGLAQAQFALLDANGDGQLTQSEINQFLNPSSGGCNCGKADFTLNGLKSRMGDVFLAGLALLTLMAFSARRPYV